MKLTYSVVICTLALGLLCRCTSNTENTDETAMVEQDSVGEQTTPALSVLWQTDTTFTTVESVLYDPDSDRLFASNIQGAPTEKDGKGSISILSPNGKVISMDWVTGLNAPKGMAIMAGKLYVTDIDRLVEIDLATGKITRDYPVEGAEFLNDAATDGSSIYFSDTNTGKIHQLKDGEVVVFREGAKSINGLAVNRDNTLYGLDEGGVEIFGADSTEVLNNVVTGGDGLVIINDSTYLASRWQGEIYLIRNGREEKLLDTKDSLNTADIGFIPDKNIVLVPTFMGNKVAAYQLTY